MRIADPVALAEVSDGSRPSLDSFLAGSSSSLRALAEAIRDQYQQPPPHPAAAVPARSRGRAMTSYRIVHRTTYNYDSEVTGSYGQFHLRPRDLPWQSCLAHEIEIDPEPADLFRHTDLYGNTKAYFHVVRPHTQLTVTAISVVEVGRAELDPAGAGAALGGGSAGGSLRTIPRPGRRPTSPSPRRTSRSRRASRSTRDPPSRPAGRSARRPST